MELNSIQFFKEIAKIPRESGNEKQIGTYLCQFAKERNLFYECDQYHNVLIKKKTIDKEPIILQVHTDMVCEKEEGKEFDFEKDAIEVIEENGYLRAEGTTLGADNGIGVAQILAILDSDIPCNIEAIFTATEETSMVGAMNFDTSKLEGKKLLNLDGFEENVILMESACFYDIILKLKNEFNKPKNQNTYEIILSGMKGGHSGFDINKEHGNSNIELARLLEKVEDIEINDFVGGAKFNVIPSQAKAQIVTNLVAEKMNELCQNTQRELQEKYPEVKITVVSKNRAEEALNTKDSKEFLQKIIQFPHGVLYKNSNQEVTTSINLGAVNLQGQELKVGMRSSKQTEEQECLNLLKNYSKKYQLDFTVIGSQPGFESDPNSSLIQELLKAHPIEEFHKLPELKSVHITVEVGFFKQKIPDLQIAIISPKIQGAHTTKECVEIASISRTDKWLMNFI
ncbi:MAG: aminoacyl-histidine dipeptidase [Clostridia bacterium]|jgi:dipeptidase D|nr:aminoacyl-histidine dipeptidase [Clostridia bacterium]MCI9413516.1 aminoacyl-histidine dipeptidase [Clostridia bacterium]